MKHNWRFVKRWMMQALALMALLVSTQGFASAQTLAFQPGVTSLVAGVPQGYELDFFSQTFSPISYVGPANALNPIFGFSSVATDNYGNVYLSEGDNAVRVIASGNGPIPVLASSVPTPQAGYAYTVFGTGIDVNSADSNFGSPNPVSSSCTSPSDNYGDGCLATQAVFENIYGSGLAVDSKGNVYLTDPTAGLIRVVYAEMPANEIPGLPANPQVGYVYAIAGVADNYNYTGQSGLATSTPISQPYGGVAVDPSGNIYFPIEDTNTGKAALLAVFAGGNLPGITNPTIGDVYTISGESGTSTSGLPASQFMFQRPDGSMASDAYGNIYIFDANTYSIWVLYIGQGSIPGLSNLTSGSIYQVAGGGTERSSFFTPTSVSQALVDPVAVAIDNAGNLYIADQGGPGIDKVDPSGNLVTVYGLGSTDCVTAVDQYNDGCAADAATLAGETLFAMAVDQQGNFFVPDTNGLLHESNVTTSSLYFGYAQSGIAPVLQTVAIYNTASPDSTGAHDLKISGLATSSSAFSVVALSTIPAGITAECSTLPTLTPGQSCETQISYTAGSSAATGVLTVTSNSANTYGTNTIQVGRTKLYGWSKDTDYADYCSISEQRPLPLERR